MGGFIVSDQLTYSVYADHGLNYNYQNNQDGFYQNDYRVGEHEYYPSVADTTWLYQNNGMNQMPTPGNVGIPSDAHWDSSMAYTPDDRNQVGDQVRVNTGVRTWATGEGMPSWVHGRVYPVIETRTRNGVNQLLLGGINSWIRLADVTVVPAAPTPPAAPAPTPPPAPPTTIRINDQVQVNQGVRTWATGEGMPSWVHGRVYPVIQIRTRDGATQLLLRDINSWIWETDVTKVADTPAPAPPPAPPPTAVVRVNDRVRVKQGVRTWATTE